MKRKRPYTLLFICTGNTCRSPMAAAILRHRLEREGRSGVEVFSRGLAALPGAPLSDGAREALAGAGVPAPDHHAGRLEPEDVARADLILTMEEYHRRRVVERYPDAEDRTFTLRHYAGEAGDIEDPIGGSPADYEKCRIAIQDALLAVHARLKSAERHQKGNSPL